MVKKHLSRLSAPKSWSIQRKGIKWISRPSPGPHGLKNCIPLNLIIKRILKYAKTTKEVKKILNDSKVLVDKRVRKDHKLPVSVMDVLEIPETKEHFRVVYDSKGNFTVHNISAEEGKLKPTKIVGKTILKGKKTQLNLYDGKNIIVDKDNFKVNDTIVLSLGDNLTIKKHLKFEKGALVYLVEGKYKGVLGTIKDIKQIFGNPTITVKSKDKTFETSRNFAFVIDKSISLGESK